MTLTDKQRQDVDDIARIMNYATSSYSNFLLDQMIDMIDCK